MAIALPQNAVAWLCRLRVSVRHPRHHGIYNHTPTPHDSMVPLLRAGRFYHKVDRKDMVVGVKQMNKLNLGLANHNFPEKWQDPNHIIH